MPKRTARPLTDAMVRAAKPVVGARRALRDAAVPGLELRISPGGAKSWSFRYRNLAGEMQRMTLGDFPTLSLKDAREAAEEARFGVTKGRDPQADKRAAQAEARAQTIRTVSDLADAYLENSCSRKAESTIAVERQRLSKHILPAIGALSLDRVTRAHIRNLARTIAVAGSGVTANRCVAIVRALYAFAIDDLDLDLKNPAARQERVYVETPRTRVLSPDEIKTLWSALLAAGEPSAHDGLWCSRQMARALMLCFVTAQRPGEVVGMSAGEVDLANRVWVIPAARTKNRRAHAVPLSQMALDLICDALTKETRFVFPSPYDATRSITRHALTRAMARLTTGLGIEKATPHDLRRTAGTIMASERLGVSRYTVSRLLNHASDTGGAAHITAQVYALSDELPAKRAALDSWANEIRRMTCGVSGSNVIPMAG